MDRSKLNYGVDFLMALSFLVVASTALVLFFAFESGIQRGGYQEFLGVIKQSWFSVHRWFGLFMIALVILHLVLHTKWAVSMTKSLFQRRKTTAK
jgi:hypothetical protein